MIQRSYSIINIVGLSIGIAAFILIALNIQYEKGYNKQIPDADRVYRCVEIQHAPGVGEQHVAVTMGPLAEAMENDFPEIEMAVRLTYWGSQQIIYNDNFFNQEFIVFADEDVFDLFGVELLKGDAETALKETNSIVLSQNSAEKIFGSVDSAMGEIVEINDRPYTVTAIIEDQPEQSSFRMEGFIPFHMLESRFEWLRSWGNNSLDTYVRLKEGTNVEELSQKFPEFIRTYNEADNPDWQWSLYLQPVDDIHLESGHIKFQVMNFRQGNIVLVYVFTIIAALIIFLACINFINLSIAQSVKRSREVGMRKVVGADRINIMNQFLGESTIITAFSIGVALLLVHFLMPYFNQLLGTTFSIDFAGNWIFNIGLLLILLTVSIVAGFYPAFYLSRYNPVRVLKGGVESEGSSSGWLTKSLVIFQFVISIGMIFSIAVTWDQYKYALEKDPGINYTDIVSVNLFNHNDSETVSFLKNEFKLIPNVIDVALAANVNGVSGSQGTITVDDTTETRLAARWGFVDYNYFDVMEIPIISGRNFSKNYALDDSGSAILNRSAVEILGWDDAIGKQFRPFLDTVTGLRVIGVIEDYHYYSMHEKIEPAIYMIDDGRSSVLAVKISGINKKEALNHMESVWEKHFPGVPFSYNMAEDLITQQYSNEESTVKIFSFFTILSIVISCLGLYGLTALLVERMSREIGVRKVFGGSAVQITQLLINNFVKLILIAGIIATPIAWYLMNKSLESFAYHIDISWQYFVISILAAIIIAVLTIIYHAFKAATKDPVETLRYE